MKPTDSHILTINGGSSSIKFALYEAIQPLKCRWQGTIDRIGLAGTKLTFQAELGKPPVTIPLAAANHPSAAKALLEWLEAGPDFSRVSASVGVGFRYFLSFAPIRADLAFPLNPPTGVKEQAFQIYISIGQSF